MNRIFSRIFEIKIDQLILSQVYQPSNPPPPKKEKKENTKEMLHLASFIIVHF